MSSLNVPSSKDSSDGLIQLLVAIGLISGAAWAASVGAIEVSLKDVTAANVGTRLLQLVFVALIIERAVEVFVNNRYGPDERLANRQIRLSKSEIESCEASLSREIERQLPVPGPGVEITAVTKAKEAAVEVCRQRVEAANEKLNQVLISTKPVLDDIRTKKQRTASIMATLLGVAVAVVGIRVLGQFLPFDADMKVTGPLEGTTQLWWFRAVDIFLTALLLAGGADGIHKIIKDFVKASEDV